MLNFSLHDGVADHFGERGHGSDFNTAVQRFDAAEFFDLAEVDDELGALDAVFEPVETVEAAGENPGTGAVAVEEPSASSVVAGWRVRRPA